MEESKKLHVAMFPWLAFGHIMPYLEFTKKLAQKGHTVSFISTPKNIARMPKNPETLEPSIALISLPFTDVDPNLPQNAEATMDIAHHQQPLLKKAYDSLRDPVACFLEARKPDWIIYDFGPYWLPPIASSLGILRAHLCILNAASFTFIGALPADVLASFPPRTEPEHFTVPPGWVPFPSRPRLRLFEAKRTFGAPSGDSPPGSVSDFFRATSVIQGCDAFLVRTCVDVEREWLEFLPGVLGKPVVPTGLLPISGESDDSDTSLRVWEGIESWLGKFEERSVVFAGFGSEVRLSPAEIGEVALGLELSGLPFFLVSLDGGLPEGFEERVRGRGKVWAGWAPQARILGHRSVGGYLMHAGWGSIIEGLRSGLPLVMLPFVYDQGPNARAFDGDVGVEVPRDEGDGSFTREAVAETLRLVVVADEGQRYRDRARKMMGIYGDAELQDRYANECIQYLQMRRSSAN